MRFLNGVRVLELGQMAAAPFATMHLGDLGAEVLKIERPGTGDIVRDLPPKVDGVSSQYIGLNRNKRSIALDLRSDRGRAAVYRLVEDCDVVIESFRPGRTEELGLDYVALSERNPDVVYCSVKGFDAGSIYEDATAFDPVAQAMGGVMSITGPEDGPPSYVGVPIGDLTTAMYASQAVLGALFDREFNDGGGEHVEISMLNAMISFLSVRLTASGTTGEPYPSYGNKHPGTAPYKVFEAADGHVMVAVASQNLWAPFCEAIGRDDLVDDPRFATNADRVEHMDELYEILDEVMLERTAEDWFERFYEHGVPSGPIRDTQEVIQDEYTAEQDLLQWLATASAPEPVPVVRYPANFERASRDEPQQPPDLGADTVTVLESAGYDEATIESMLADGVAQAGPSDS